MHALNKCRKLWAKAGRPGTSEIIVEVLGHTLSSPGETRWNSYFDSISQILHEETKPKLAILHEKLGLTNFKENEIQYLEDCCQVMKPLAAALDILQGDTNTYFGYLLPTLISLANKWNKMKKYFQGARHFGASLILNACLEGLLRRFSALFQLESEEAIIASITCPKFRLRWFNTLNTINQANISISTDCLKQMVILAADHLLEYESSNGDASDSTEQDVEYDGYFDFNDESPTPGSPGQSTSTDSHKKGAKLNWNSYIILKTNDQIFLCLTTTR